MFITLKPHKPHYGDVPFEVPDNWVWTTLGDIFTLQAGKNITAKTYLRNKIRHIVSLVMVVMDLEDTSVVIIERDASR